MYIDNNNNLGIQPFDEIGSEFWLSSKPDFFSFLLPKWLSKFGNVVFTSSGRGAISLLLGQVEPKFKSVLLPAYICESVILPFIKHGYRCYFYDVHQNFAPNLEKIKTFERIGIFYHMGYYGFSTNNNLDGVISHFKAQSTLIVEDVTHTLFSDIQRFSDNDFYVGSIRKWFGVPGGGFLASSASTVNGPLLSNENLSNLRKEALFLKGEYMKTREERLKRSFMNLFSEAEIFLDKDVDPYYIDELSMELISNLDQNHLFNKRRTNYQTLSNGLKHVSWLESPFPQLADHTCPLFYPIFIKSNRQDIQKKLIEEKIFCPVHWPMPDQIEYKNHEVAEEIYNTILSIPCDQRYGIEDMERIVTVINN